MNTFLMFSAVLLLVGNSWSRLLSRPDFFSKLSTLVAPFSVLMTLSISSMKSSATPSLTWCSLMMTWSVFCGRRPEETQRAVT